MTFLMRFFLICSIMLIIGNTLFAQNHKSGNKKSSAITGVLIDSVTNRPIEYANFLLYRHKDSTLFNGTRTDSAGKIILSDIPKGVYFAKISIVGYKSRKRNNITINTGESIDLDTIRLTQKNIHTKEVEIISGKERIVEEDDKIIINPNRSMGSNAAEVLEYAPMVNIDINGKISLLGQRGTAVYIDGIPAQKVGYETVEDLKLLSIPEIEKIELIPEPSLEYNEKSNGGIINIITRKKTDTKYSGYTSLNGDTKNRFNSNLGLAYSYKDIFTKASYSKRYSDIKSNTRIDKTISPDNGTSYLEQTGDYENKPAVDLITMNLGYNPNKYNNLNTIISFSKRETGNQKTIINKIYGAGINEDVSGYSNLNNIIQYYFTGSIIYQKQFPEKGRKLSSMAAITTNSMDMDNNTERRNLIIPDLFSREYNNSANKNNTFMLKLSYDHPLGEEHLLETGYEGTFKVLKMNSKYSRFNAAEQEWTDIPSQKIMNKYTGQSHNIYGQVNGTLYDVKYSIGFSYDKYHLGNEELLNGKYFEGDYSGLIPWISFSRKLFPGHTLSISFTSKSYYPENRQINPYMDYTDSTELKMGNPDLEPFYNKTVALNYRITLQDLLVRMGTSYSDISNKIELITTQENRLLAVTTYKNLSGLKSLQAYIYANKKLAEWLILEPQFNFYNQEYKSPDVKNTNFTWSSFLRAGISLNTFKFQVDFRYSSPDISAQSKTKSNFYANAAMKALFFDKHLSISLSTEDIFNTLNQNRDIYGRGFYSINKRNEATRIISLGISYYFQKRADDAIEEPEKDEYDDF